MNNLCSNFSPDWVSPPGDTILDIIEDKGWSQSELADRLGFSPKFVSHLINGKVSITNETATKLSNTLGSSEGFWLAREAKYQERIAMIESYKKFSEWITWLDNLPVKQLMDAGQISKRRLDKKNKPSVVGDCLRFFGIASPNQWKEVYESKQVSFRRSREDQCNIGAITSWLRIGEKQLESGSELPKYDKRKLLSSLPSIRNLAGNDLTNFDSKLVKILNSAGVSIIFVPSIKGAHVSGIARWISPTQPVIQMSLYGKYHDKFWFTLYHELAHILLHAESKEDKQNVFLDDPYNVKSRDPKEVEADLWASDKLIPTRYIGELQKLRSKESVTSFANKIDIHPGIVVGRLQHDKLIESSWMNDLRVKIDFSE